MHVFLTLRNPLGGSASEQAMPLPNPRICSTPTPNRHDCCCQPCSHFRAPHAGDVYVHCALLLCSTITQWSKAFKVIEARQPLSGRHPGRTRRPHTPPPLTHVHMDGACGSRVKTHMSNSACTKGSLVWAMGCQKQNCCRVQAGGSSCVW